MKTIKERQKLARKYKDSTHSRCVCCNMPASIVNMKSLTFEINQNSSSSYGKLCNFCFNHPDNSFQYIYELYTKKGTYPHEDFTESQLDTIIDSISDELKVNESFRNKYLQESRDDILKILLEN